MLLYFCLFTVILEVSSTSAPFIKPCKEGDNACAVASAQAAVPIIAPGLPELGIESLDPMTLPLVNGDQGALKLTFKNTVVTGMKGCSVDGIETDFVKNKQQVTIRCTVELTGDYKLGGQLLVLPIRGEGKYKINIRDIVIKSHSELTKVTGADGKEHWHVKSWRHTSHVKTGAKFHFDNLFNGNKILADSVEDFVNTSWREVMEEVSPPIVTAIVTKVVGAVEKLYKAVPYDELTIK